MCAEVGQLRIRTLPDVDWDVIEFPELKWACKAANVWRQRSEPGVHSIYVLQCEACGAAWCEQRLDSVYIVGRHDPKS